MSRRVLVASASRSISRTIVYQPASDRFDVFAHCHSGRAEADAIVIDIQTNRGNARVLQFGVCDRAACRTQLDVDVEAHSAYYGIVLCVGVTRDATFPVLTGENWDIVLETGLDGFYDVIHPLTMPMARARKGGCIVTIAPVSRVMGNYGQVSYSATKAGLIGATEALAVELASHKIIVNYVTPRLTETDTLARMEHVDQVLQTVPMQRVGQPTEAAVVVGFLMSDAVSYVTR